MIDEAHPAPHPFTLDGHEDAYLYAQMIGGPDAFDAGVPDAQLDLPGLRAAEVDAAFWAIFVEGEEAEIPDGPACADQVDEMLAGYRAWIDDSPHYHLVRRFADLEALAAADRDAHTPLGVLLHCEGARGIAGPAHLYALHADGLRSVGLTWNGANRYATGAEGDPDRGLTAAGRELVRELNRLNMMIDASHLNARCFWDVLDLSTSPVVVTHAACAALYPHPRNLTDDQIRAVAAQGGLIGVFYANVYLAPEDSPADIGTVLAHYDHLLDIAGPDHVALGSDFGGLPDDETEIPAGLEQVGYLPRLYAGLAALGCSPATLAAIRGGNYLRVLGEILD
jgi:membrane dipeptidase